MIDCVDGTVLPAPSEEHVRDVEDYYGISFPEDYLELLKAANGGVPLRRQFHLGNRERMIERFLPVLDDAGNDEKHGWADVEVVASQLDSRLATDPDGENIDLIPIAALFAGDFLVLDYSKGEPPTIAVWNHEASTDFAPVVEAVAGDLASFLGSLQA
jgi:hypothetical protein